MQRIFFGISVVAVCLIPADCWAQRSDGAKTSVTVTGQITGRVIDSSGEPLAGASVYAAMITSTVQRKSATVDNHGDFKIDRLEAGLYSVSATMPGYVLASPRSSGDSPNYYRIGDSVTFTLTKGGVITGTVTGPNGPLVGVGVFATRVRDAEGKKLSAAFPGGFERRTDDRGVFRMYGLPPGAYVVMATRPRIGTILPSAYDLDTPTYYPSGTRDTAAEIVVREGDEITADIRYRAELGHAISGKVLGIVDNQAQFGGSPQITLTEIRDRTQIANGATSLTNNSIFAIWGVPDGEYELSSWQSLPSRDVLRSQPQRVTMRGADVTGINLTLAPLASIDGRVVFESAPKSGCGMRKESTAQETLVYARRYEPEKKTAADARSTETLSISISAATYSVGASDAKGSFTLRNLPSGSYHIDPRAPASGWYVRSITIRAATAARKSNSNIARDGIALKSGERVSGVTVTFTEGGASLRGRVSITEGQRLPTDLRVYLTPAERESAENVLRFFETRVEADGRFEIGNVAPGRYWITARPAEEIDANRVKLIRQDADSRARVLLAAEGLKKEISLKPCERVADYDLAYMSAPAAKP